MSQPLDIKASDAVQTEKGIHQVEDTHNLEQDAKLSSYKAAAMEAELAEQKSTVLQAVREYPMAAFWAFIMSCTIVSHFANATILKNAVDIVFRSWKRTVYSSWEPSLLCLRSRKNSAYHPRITLM